MSVKMTKGFEQFIAIAGLLICFCGIALGIVWVDEKDREGVIDNYRASLVSERQSLEETKPPQEIIQKIILRKVYVQEEDFSRYKVDEIDTVSYWYYTYNVSRKKTAEVKASRWEGYDVCELDGPYFDVNKVRKIAYPEVVEKDFVKISFFKRVSFETYKAYSRDE